MKYMLILVYAGHGIDVFGPWDEACTDTHVRSILDSRDEQPVAVYRLSSSNLSKAVEWKVIEGVCDG